MADSTFGLKIGLEGEREFKKAIADINREMRVLGSEMKVVASQFGKNATDADALTARNQVLGKEIEAQRSKIQALKAALDNASASFGQSDSRTQNWRIQLNNATATLNDMERELSENTSKIDELTTAAGSSEGELKDAASGADKLSREVDELGGELDDTSGKTRIFGDVLKANLAAEAIIGGVKAIGGAIAGIGRGFAQAMKDGVAYNASMEQYTTSFTTMLGDQAKAQQLVNDLKTTAAKTPFGMEDLAKNTQTLMTFGISADEAKLRLGQLGDISQGDAQKLESLTLAFAQVSSAGKLSGQDLLQMINAGFNPLQEMSKKTGKSVGELKEEMEKGAISADMVADAFASATAEGGQFYGAMEAQSKTFSGQVSTLQDGVAGLKGALAGGLSSMLASTALPAVNSWVDALTAGFESGGVAGLLQALGTVVDQAAQFLATEVPKIGVELLKTLDTIVQSLSTMGPSIATLASTVVTTVIGGILNLLPGLLDVGVQILTALIDGIGQGLPGLLVGMAEVLAAMVQVLADNLPMILAAALQLITGLAQGLIQALPVLIEALPQIIQALVDFIIAAIPMIIDAGIQLLTSIVTALPTIIEAIVAALPQIITSIVTGLLTAIPMIIDAGIRLLTALIGALPQIIQTLVAAMPTIIAAVINALLAALPQLVQAGIRLLTSLITALPQIIGTIVGALPQIISAIVGGLASGYGQLADVGMNLVRGLWNGIQSLAGWLWNKVANWCASIWDGITDYFGIHSPSKQMAWIGDMLTRGLAGGITATGARAVDAAQAMAGDVTDTLAGLASGVRIPVAVTPGGTPASASVGGLTGAASAGGVDVEAIATQAARAVIDRLDIQVRLNDGTLVGRLAPLMDRAIAGRARASTLLPA